MQEWITKYRNALLAIALVIMLAVSAFLNKKQAARQSATTSLPITYATSSTALNEMEQYRRRRDDTMLEDMAALQSILDNTALESQTRSDASDRLQLLVDRREKQSALEGALLETSLWPCVAVVNTGSVSIVTEKTSLSDRENALLLELSQVHTGVEPSGVRVICAEKK